MIERRLTFLKTKQWIKVTFWGWLLGVLFLILLSSLLDSLGIEDMQFYIGIGMGAGVGLLQWRLLRKYYEISILWFIYSSIGMGLPFLIFDFLVDPNLSYKLPLSVAIGGLLVGLLQYQMFKAYASKAFVWVFASALGWTLAAFTTLLINYTMQFKVTGYLNLVLALLNLGIILAGGWVLGWITAKALKQLQTNSHE